MTPLEQLQPSIAALTKAYFSDFPEIVERRPILRRVVQFSGLALIQQIQAIIQYQKPLTIQVSACSRLPNFICRPNNHPDCFGMAEYQLTCLSRSLA